MPWYEYSFHQHKLANAVKHGAAGMIYNYGPIANPNNDYYEDFVYVHIGDTVVRDLQSQGCGQADQFNTQTQFIQHKKGCNS